jgi:mRNA interferase MazF
MTDIRPKRGEFWLIDLSPVRGHEQSGRRPGLVISVDLFNQSPAELIIIIPVTTRKKEIRSHVLIEPSKSGLNKVSFIKCEDIQSVSKERLIHRLGKADQETLSQAEDKLRILMDL